MKTRDSECRPSQDTGHLSRLPNLGASVLQFDLFKEIEELRKKSSWDRETGRSSKTLVKQQDFRIVLVLMKPIRGCASTKLMPGFQSRH